MHYVYKSVVTRLGPEALSLLEAKTIIIFAEPVPLGLEEYSIMHTPQVVSGEVRVGQVLWINEEQFDVTAIGQVANKNLKNLGHITIKFDGNMVADLPGCIHVSPKSIPSIQVGSIIAFSD